MDLKTNQFESIEEFFDILIEYKVQWNQLQSWLAQEIRYLTSATADNEHKLSVAIVLYFLKYDREMLESLIAQKNLFSKLKKTTNLCFKKYNNKEIIDTSILVDFLLTQQIFNNEHGLKTSIAICFQYFPEKLDKVYELLSKKHRYINDVIYIILIESMTYQRDDGILDFIDGLFISNPLSTIKGHIYCYNLKSWFLLDNTPKEIKDKILVLAEKWLSIVLNNPEIALKIMVNQENGLVLQILLAIICENKNSQTLVFLQKIISSSTLVIGIKFEALMYAYDLYRYIPDNKDKLILEIAQKESIFSTEHYSGKYPLEQFLSNINLCDINSLLLIAKCHHHPAAKALQQRIDIVDNLIKIIDEVIENIGNIINYIINGTYKYHHLKYVGYFIDFLCLNKKEITNIQYEYLLGYLHHGLVNLRRSEFVEYYIRLDKKIPTLFEDFINPWRKHYLILKQKNITLQDLHPKLVRALVIKNTPKDVMNRIDFDDLLSYSKNTVLWRRKDIDTSRFEWFSELVAMIAPDLKLQELEHDDDVINETFICLNKDNSYVDEANVYYYCCFESLGQKYFFRLFSSDIRPIAIVVDYWMEILGRPSRCYELAYVEGYGGHTDIFFSADPLYFQELIDDYAFPAKRVSE